MRLPNGACTTSCIPPDSSKKRSSTMQRWLGIAPSAARPSARNCATCSARSGRDAGLGHDPGRTGALVAHAADLQRQLRAATRALAEPEGQVRRRTLRVGDAHGAGLDLEHAPGRVPELEDVVDVGLDREVLVQRADEQALGLAHHAVVGVVGDRARSEQHRQPRALRRHDAPADRVAVQQRQAAAGMQRQQRVEVLARQVAVRKRATQAREELVFLPALVRIAGHAGRDDLLRQDVERRRRARRARRGAALHGREQGHGFAPLRPASAGRCGPSAGARRRGRRGRRAAGTWRSSAGVPIWQTRSMSPMSMPSSSEAVATRAFELAVLQALLGGQPRFARQAAVVARDRVLAQRLGQARRQRARPACAC